tara:strand:- start:2318 stop:2626 length:309 start_codon:yes stop_codon:yes gene_type:complete
MEKTKKYKGYTNYATWKVQEELFKDYDFFQDDYFLEEPTIETLVDLVENWVFENHTGNLGLIEEFARAFLADVNYHEILEHILEDFSNEDQSREFLNKQNAK